MLPGLKIFEQCMLNELIECFEREHLASCREKHLLHIFAANAEPSAAYAGDDLEGGLGTL